MEQTEKDSGTVAAYPCTCRGCRGYRQDYSGIYHADQIADRIRGHYFDADTKRFFRSRVNAWRELPGGGFVVRESVSGDWDHSYRVHRVVTFCPYGELVEQSEKFSTGKRAEVAFRQVSEVAGCTCHGCEIDRAGRTDWRVSR